LAETIFVNPLKDIYNSLRPILKDNNIEIADTQEDQKRIGKIVDSLVKVQNELVRQNKNTDIKLVL
jgi:hypothetical protein